MCIRDSIYSLTSKPFTDAAKRVAKLEVSKESTIAAPDTPASRLLQLSETVLPTGVIAPRPVTTTFRALKGDSSGYDFCASGTAKTPASRIMVVIALADNPGELTEVRVYVVYSLLNSADFLGLFVWNFALKFFFKSHDQLYCICLLYTSDAADE